MHVAGAIRVLDCHRMSDISTTKNKHNQTCNKHDIRTSSRMTRIYSVFVQSQQNMSNTWRLEPHPKLKNVSKYICFDMTKAKAYQHPPIHIDSIPSLYRHVSFDPSSEQHVSIVMLDVGHNAK